MASACLSSDPLNPPDQIELVRQLAQTEVGATITCASPSMEPTILVGQEVRVVHRKVVVVGDVILFETVDGLDLVLHRVVLTVPGTPWIAQVGDASRARATALVHTSRVVGVAIDIAQRKPRTKVLAAAVFRFARRGVRVSVDSLRRRGLR